MGARRYGAEHVRRNSLSPSNHVLFCLFINIFLTRRSRLNSRFKKRTRCHPFMVLNRASDNVSSSLAFFFHVWFFFVVEILGKHSSLYNKAFLNIREFQSRYAASLSGKAKRTTEKGLLD